MFSLHKIHWHVKSVSPQDGTKSASDACCGCSRRLSPLRWLEVFITDYEFDTLLVPRSVDLSRHSFVTGHEADGPITQGGQRGLYPPGGLRRAG